MSIPMWNSNGSVSFQFVDKIFGFFDIREHYIGPVVKIWINVLLNHFIEWVKTNLSQK